MAEPRENKMGVMPVKKLIITMSLPMMISMLVQALYNVVDSMFVARLSEDALTAVTLAFPMQNALISFAAGTGVGINALLSKSLGEKKFDRADAAANNGLFLGGGTLYRDTDPGSAGQGIRSDLPADLSLSVLWRYFPDHI